ncbi:hypothetical protein N0V82_006463 [Gnomoniopsis sp. IMI 355080]|nr:hypothetical protein N0V82_006463 [Gnomoniopsis sp. IMI 355080]
MGASSSKQSGSGPTHVWKGSSPASVSQDMIESLQSSSETDASRAQLIESQIQARVATELRKLHDEETSRLSSLLAKVADETAPESTPTSRHKASKEIEELERKLQTRKLVKEVPESVEISRSEVVRCLRENDRRPLDCWKEVQAFKEEVRRLEKGWVERVIS